MDRHTQAPGDAAADAWFDALEARHLADLRPVEVTRALRALSSAYVERRGRLSHGAALDGAGKRAAFALFYGPLHFLLVRAILREVEPAPAPTELLVDLGCGTGVAGAAWALRCGPGARVLGIERHPWAADEARWTCRTLGVAADITCTDVARLRLPSRASGIVAAYTVNELPPETRERLLRELLAAHDRGTRVLVIEPIAKSLAPWWPSWADAVRAAGGREDTWRFPADLPAVTRRLDRAAGLDHRELTGRSLYLPGRIPKTVAHEEAPS
jgi:SAM-dependent methyltransferase